jgi:hypothetical protein
MRDVVAGLLTDGQGEPLSIELYRGNPGDPPTFLDAVQALKVRFGAEESALVGDRGMIKRMGKAALGEAHFRYVSALTDPQIRALLKRGVLPMELFEEKPAEVEWEGKRYVLRCNPQTQARERSRREDKWQRVKAKIVARNEAVAKSPKKQAASSLRQAEQWIRTYRLGQWVRVSLEGRQVVWVEDEAAREAEGQLDGCYVVESDLPPSAATTEQVHDRYLDLGQVERDFRTLKTGLLELRPIFLRKAGRTRGHALATMLALKLAREVDRRVAPLGLTVADAMERLGGSASGVLGGSGAGIVADGGELSGGPDRNPGSFSEATGSGVVSNKTERATTAQSAERTAIATGYGTQPTRNPCPEMEEHQTDEGQQSRTPPGPGPFYLIHRNRAANR